MACLRSVFFVAAVLFSVSRPAKAGAVVIYVFADGAGNCEQPPADPEQVTMSFPTSGAISELQRFLAGGNPSDRVDAGIANAGLKFCSRDAARPVLNFLLTEALRDRFRAAAILFKQYRSLRTARELLDSYSIDPALTPAEKKILASLKL